MSFCAQADASIVFQAEPALAGSDLGPRLPTECRGGPGGRGRQLRGAMSLAGLHPNTKKMAAARLPELTMLFKFKTV